MLDTVLKAVGAVVLVIVGAAALGLLLTYPLMWAINYTVAPAALLAVFGVAKLTFWKTYIFTGVCSWLFKSTTTNNTSK